MYPIYQELCKHLREELELDLERQVTTMKTFMKYTMILGMTLVAILLMSGNTGAVVLAPEDSDSTFVRPGLGFGGGPVVIVAPRPRPALNPFRFFNPFAFNPFINVNPFFGFDDDAFFGFEEEPFFGRERFADD